MENKFQGFLDIIHMDKEIQLRFNDVFLNKVVVSKKNNMITLILDVKKIFDVELYKTLVLHIKNYFNASVLIKVNNLGDRSLYLEEYYRDFLNDNLKYFADRLKIHGNSNNYIIVFNNAEYKQISNFLDKLNNHLTNLGYNPLTIYLDEDMRGDVVEQINNDLKNTEIPKEKIRVSNRDEDTGDTVRTFEPRRRKVKTIIDSRVHLGEVIEGEIVDLGNIVSEDSDLIIEAEIFGLDVFESSKSNFKIITLKLTDYTDSLYAKIFLTDADELVRLSGILKPGKWFKFKGYTKRDKYAQDEIVFNVNSINVSDRKKETIMDNYPEKRVELHVHTMMSAMDSVSAITKHGVEIIDEAIKWGHKAIAITDHNGCQAFPNAFNQVTSYNKGKKEEEKFKVIYGVELTLVDDNVEIVKRANEDSLLDSEYVVFDLETTGFNAAAGDTIIEIGAVKLLHGEIIDKFDILIKPPVPITDKITNVTSITNEMVADCCDEETAIKEFIKWIGDHKMVAHNAKFDTSFIDMCYKKYGLGEFTNTVIDTLALSRLLDQDASRHGLSYITKRYDVAFDEGSHHRGDYDALATALVFHKMMKKLESINIMLVSDLDNLVNIEDIHKYGRSYHVNLLVQNKVGLKNLFKIISIANTKHYYRGARVLRSELEELREGILVGSGCAESEVFIEAKSKTDEELRDIIGFYDYVEVQAPEVYNHLIQLSDFKDENELKSNIKKIINLTKAADKFIVATGDVHHTKRSEKIYREIIVNQKLPGGGLHPLSKKNITDIPSQHFRTTEEMMNDFSFLGDELAHEIVIENSNKIADLVEIVEVIIDTGGIPFSPKFPRSREEVYEMVYEKAHSMYGEPLPAIIEERIAQELYGDGIIKLIENKLKKDNKDLTNEDLDKLFLAELHNIIKCGYDEVFKISREEVIDELKNDAELKDKINDEKYLEKETKKRLGGIIGGGFDVIYLIAQKLVKHSNDEGYLVGSRGSVGSSFVATMMNITEVNPLPAHYLCGSCKLSFFEDDDGVSLSKNYSASGYDLPDKECPKCHIPMIKEGQDMPFATFLGFNADKVPDIDLNFSGENQSSAHAYTKVLFGEDNVYRAGTIGTVAEKTAFGFVKGYLEKKGTLETTHIAEIERLASGCTGVKRTTGQHPGGIVVIPDYMEVFDFTPFQFPADDVKAPWRTTHFDYHAIDQDLLKLDILGHDDPTILRMLKDLSGIDPTTLPPSDPKVLSLLTSPEALGVTSDLIRCPIGTLGLPEMGTNFVINMLAKAKPRTFGELVKISGLSHGTDVWSGNAEYLIDNNIVPFKDVIGCRDDIMVYLANNGLKPKDAFKIMELVRKGKASKDPEGWANWVKVMKEKNIPDWYIESCFKIKYMFPKAHACAYVLSAMRIAWFKVHKPLYYYATYFSVRIFDFDLEVMIKGYDAIKMRVEDFENKGYEITKKETDVYETLKIALEASARGIKFANVSLYKSDAMNFLISEDEENTLIPPFRAIDGLGGVAANAIIKEREEREFLSIEDLQMRGKVSSTLIDKMKSMKVLDGMQDTNQLSLF